MPLRRPDPGTFESLLEEVRVPVSSLMRLSRWPATEPYWSRGRYRFDGPTGGSFGSCYAADRLDVAFCESVMHEASWFDGSHHVVPAADLMSRRIVTFERPAFPELLLADFTGRPLKRLALNGDISAADDYALPQAWAWAVFEADPKWDGIRYVSRQLNVHTAVAIFEHAADPARLMTRKAARKLTDDELDALCDDFNVAVV